MNEKVRINIGGKNYVVVGQDNEQHINNVALLVDRDLEDVSRTYPSLSLSDKATLTAINIADDYIKSEKKYIGIIEDIKSSESELKLKVDSLINEVIDLKSKLEKARETKAEEAKFSENIQDVKSKSDEVDPAKDHGLDFNSENYHLEPNEEILIIKTTSMEKPNDDRKNNVSLDDNAHASEKIEEIELSDNTDETQDKTEKTEAVDSQRKFDFNSSETFDDYYEAKTRILFEDMHDGDHDD